MKLAAEAVVVVLCLLVILPQYAPAREAHEEANIVDVRTSHDLKQIKIKFSGRTTSPIAYVVERPYRLIMDFKSTGLGHVPAKTTINRGPIREIRTGAHSSRARVVVDFGENPAPPFNVSRQGDLVILTLGKNHPSAEKTKSDPGKRAVAPQPAPAGASPAPAPSDHRRSENAGSRFSVKGAGLSDDLIFVELADRKDPTRAYRLVMDFDYDSLQLRTATFSDAFGNVKRFDMAQNSTSGEAPVLGSKHPSTSPRNWAAAASGSQAKKAIKKKSRGSRYAKKPKQPTVVQKGPASQRTKQKRADLAK
jgi:hypothetical protein